MHLEDWCARSATREAPWQILALSTVRISSRVVRAGVHGVLAVPVDMLVGASGPLAVAIVPPNANGIAVGGFEHRSFWKAFLSLTLP